MSLRQRFFRDPRLQRLAFQTLHHNERLAFVLADFVSSTDVGMVERRGRARLAVETFDELAVLGQLYGQELQGDRPAELGVLGLVHHAHAAPTQLFQNPVVGNGLAGHGAGTFPGVSSLAC